MGLRVRGWLCSEQRLAVLAIRAAAHFAGHRPIKVTITDQEAENGFSTAMAGLVLTVQDLLQQNRLFPAFILMYSGLDILGSMTRPKGNLDTSGTDFKNWVANFMLKGSSLHATPDDLWGARCGVLHTATARSRNSREGKAREVHYVRGDKGFAKFAQEEFDKLGEPKVVIDIDTLFDAFFDGVGKFSIAAKNDAVLKDVILHHAKTMLWHYSYKISPKQ